MLRLSSATEASSIFDLGVSLAAASILLLPLYSFLRDMSNLWNSSFQKLPALTTPNGSPAMKVESQTISASRPFSFIGEISLTSPVAVPLMDMSSPKSGVSAPSLNLYIPRVNVSLDVCEVLPYAYILWSPLTASRESILMSLPLIFAEDGRMFHCRSLKNNEDGSSDISAISSPSSLLSPPFMTSSPRFSVSL